MSICYNTLLNFIRWHSVSQKEAITLVRHFAKFRPTRIPKSLSRETCLMSVIDKPP